MRLRFHLPPPQEGLAAAGEKEKWKEQGGEEKWMDEWLERGWNGKRTENQET